MVDKGEKIILGERIKIGKRHTSEFFLDLKSRLKGKGTLIACLAVVLMIGVIFVQNSRMIDNMNKILNQAEGSVHEIYDDSKVIAAYKSGDADGLDSEDAFVLDKLKEVIGDVIKDDMTDYEKEKAIYDWQQNWTTYGEENLNPIAAAANDYTPYGVLRSHNAICVGNATTFKLFMDALDIPCKIIHSTENGEHAWNIVQLDGDWYHVDLTFDGGVEGRPGYAYFNVPDSIKDDGSWPWDHSEIPAANGSKYCYLLNNAVECDDMYQIPKAIKDAIDNDMGFATVLLKDGTGFNRTVANFISNSMYMENGGVSFSNAYSIGGKTVYKFEINNWNEEEGPDVPPEIADRLTKIIGELNGGDIQVEDEGSDEVSFENGGYTEEDTYDLTRGYK